MKLIFSLLKSSFKDDSFRMISNIFNFLPNYTFNKIHKFVCFFSFQTAFVNVNSVFEAIAKRI